MTIGQIVTPYTENKKRIEIHNLQFCFFPHKQEIVEGEEGMQNWTRTALGRCVIKKRRLRGKKPAQYAQLIETNDSVNEVNSQMNI